MAFFDQFVNQYSLQKTLRFELKPVGRTLDMLQEAKVFQKDETIYKKYEQTKPFFDQLHREFVYDALKNSVLSGISDYFETFEQWKKDKKKFEKELQKKENNLRKEVTAFFKGTAEEWAKKYSHLKIKKRDIGMLFEEEVFQILKERYGNEESAVVENENGKKVSIFDSWKGFTGYFDKFFETRKNFYQDDGSSTAIATRIVDQNLKRFCQNLQDYENLKGKNVDFSEVENNFGKSLQEIFSLNFYNTCLLQNGIDFYNAVIGGRTLDNGEKIKGINELINKYRQDHKGQKLPFLKTLDKQILSEKEMFTDEIESDEQFLEVLRNFHKTAEEKIAILKKLLKDFLINNQNQNQDEVRQYLSEIYFSKEAFNTISHKWTNETEQWETALYEVFKKAKILSSSAKKKDGGYAFPDFISLSFLKESLEVLGDQTTFWKERYYKNNANSNGQEILTANENIWEQFLKILDFEFSSLFEQKVIDSATGREHLIGYLHFEKEMEALLKNFAITPQSKVTIKNFADSVLTIYQMAKYFALEKKRKWLDEYDNIGDFYTNPDFGYLRFYENAYEEIVQTHNKLRSYLTKKPYSVEKWKLNFENPTLADGWDKNKESANFAVILRKNGKYYLGLMNKGSNKIFDDRYFAEFSKNIEKGKYEKMVYKYLPDAAKMIPKCSTQLKSVQEHFQNSTSDFLLHTKNFVGAVSLSKRVFDLNNTLYDKSNISQTTQDEKNGVKAFQKEYLRLSKDEKSYKAALYDWIDFCKDFLSKYESTKDFDFSVFKKTQDYQSLDEFYSDIGSISYRISFQDISEEYINQKNQDDELYLFQIKNKDWNEKAIGKKNLHTLYFEGLFSRENIAQNFPIKLNGQAEIFYRPKTKKLEKKKIVTQEKKVTLEKGDKAFQKNRYTDDKIFFHVPLTLNRTSSDPKYFNVTINNFLANNPDINIIGIDRGEKHLAYYSVINQKGEILKDEKGEKLSWTLNLVGEDGAKNPVDYHQKLGERAKEREQARRDWQQVQGIKDLKKGYISQVVRKLADLAIKYNAIIVFEDLNMGFKRVRSGIEKSIYQQLEKALIEKLNFLVQKGEKDPQKAGHLLKAYQLTAPFETFKQMGKQTGIIFYTSAHYTSKIDPVTGWRPHLYLKYSNADRAKEDILKFSDIVFQNGRFEFTYDIKNFRKQPKYPQKTVWTVCSNVERFRWNPRLNNNKGEYERYENLTDPFKELFNEAHINFLSGDIKTQIQALDVKGNEKFFKRFLSLFDLLCQIRNTNRDGQGNDNDFIFSPVELFFDSRKADDFAKKTGKDLPTNGDENGSFNIARKGILILRKISDFAQKNGNCEKLKWDDLYVSNEEWDDFVR